MRMKRYGSMVICAAAIVVLSICGCDGKSEETVEMTDIDKLQGTWVGSEIGGKAGQWTFVIAGDKIDAKGPEPEAYAGTMKLNPNAEPKQADFVIDKCEFKEYVGTTALSIYKIEGNKFTMAGNEPGSGIRPEGFKGDGGTRLFVFTKQMP